MCLVSLSLFFPLAGKYDGGKKTIGKEKKKFSLSSKCVMETISAVR